MTPSQIALTTTERDMRSKAEILAHELQIDFISDNNTMSYSHLLVLTSNYLGLIRLNDKKQTPFYIDFLSNKMLIRLKQAGFRNELIARAIGVKPRENPIIVDATAGLGRDSFILAALGYQVTLLERSAVLYALLRDGISRASQSKAMGLIMARMQLIHTDAIEWLDHHKADVVYLDPMFPERKKSASVKKEMIMMQELLGTDGDTSLLFEAAFTCAKKRIVVKRPRLAANIVERVPNFAFSGKSSRFDLYLKEATCTN